MKGGAKCVYVEKGVWCHSRSSARSPCNKASVTSYLTLTETMYRVRDIASYLSKIADSSQSNLHLVPQSEVTPLEFAKNFGVRKLQSESKK